MSARAELEMCVSEAQTELFASQQECQETRDRLVDSEELLTSLSNKIDKVCDVVVM